MQIRRQRAFRRTTAARCDPGRRAVLPIQRAGNLPQPFWRLSLFREDVYETAADAGRIV